MKYFSFHNHCTQNKDEFIKRLKPINNKLITSMNKIQTTEECLIKLICSLLTGFENIKNARLKCNKDYDKIVKFF